MNARPAVFLGPTLPVAEARKILDADYLPPVELGDVWRITQERPSAIGIVDGYFHRVPAVWHKEILHAMAAGIPVYGAASMGALRAAELVRHGMIPVGAIARDYIEGRLANDDEVAVVHAPDEYGYAPLCEPLVNIRATLTAAIEQSVIPPPVAQELLAVAAALHYADRAWPAILRTTAPTTHDIMKAWLPTGRVDQKKRDALAMLTQMRDAPRAPPQKPFAETVLWREFVARETPFAAILEEFLLLDPLPAPVADAIAATARGARPAWPEILPALPPWPTLCRRARHKARISESTAPEADLMSWFFETRLGWPDDLPAFLLARGWTGLDAVAPVAAREAAFLAARTGDPLDRLAPS